MVPRYRMWVVGPSYPQLDQAWEEFDHRFAEMPQTGDHSILETRCPLVDEKTRFLINDGRLQFKSADNPKSLQNVALDWVWITEAQDIPDSVWYNQISPMLHSPGVLGWAVVEGHSPKPGSFFEKLFELGQGDHPDIESLHFNTEDSPHIDWNAILLEAENMPYEAFRAEYYSETPSELGRAFNEDAIKLCIGGDLEIPQEGISYVLGVDLGKQVDPTVITVMRKAQRRIVGFERLLKQDWTLQEDTIARMAEEWNNASVYIDETGLGAPIVDHLKKRGVRVKGINLTKQKVEIVNKLAAAIEHENVRFPNIPVLIGELKNMRRYQKDRKGRYLKQEKIEAPLGSHDDCVVALALAFYGCRYGDIGTPIKPRNLMRSVTWTR